MKYALRQAALDDAPWLMRVDRACGPDCWTEFTFFNLLACADHFGVVAENDLGLVGCVVAARVIVDNRYLVFRCTDVLPEYRREGIGRSLIEHAISLARLDGLNVAVFNLPTHDARGRSFLRACGFALCCEGEAADGTPFDLFMRDLLCDSAA
jgi:N-acetylglutamate synthase-like GNAT family acetyltransferase